jgi:hypothetical protein
VCVYTCVCVYVSVCWQLQVCVYYLCVLRVCVVAASVKPPSSLVVRTKTFIHSLQAKRVGVPHSLSLAWRIGRAVLCAKEPGDAVSDIIEQAGGK